MRGYKTSKDYKRLKELLDKWYRVIGFAHNTLTDFVLGEHYYEYKGGTIASFISDDDFAEVCEFDNVEFIEPEEK